MARRPSKKQRDWMAERMGAASAELQETSFSQQARSQATTPGVVAPPAPSAFFDELENLDSEEFGPEPAAGEVFGAGTGRGRRAISDRDLRDIQWDPARPYPQMQTQSSDPDRPRTIAAGYDPQSRILRVTFRNGSIYEYVGPEPRHWSAFQRTPSPGRYINTVLEQYPYRPLGEDIV